MKVCGQRPIGAGIEYAFAGPWTGALEYLYVDTGSRSVTVLGITDNVRTRDNVLRARIRSLTDTAVPLKTPKI